MNQNKISSLYELIKEQVRAKGRKLKIISDWDECLQVLKPIVVYDFYQGPKKNFAEFFEEFWNSVDLVSSSIGSKIKAAETASNELKQAIDEQQQMLIESRDWNQKGEKNKYKDNYYISARRFQAPLLTTADDLLQALKEDLIEKLVIISSYASDGKGMDVIGKREKIQNTFGCFPQTEISLNQVKKDANNRSRPHRWEVIRDKFADFDIYVDDNESLIGNSPSTLKYMKQIPDIEKKFFALNDYRPNRKVQGPNIYHVKTNLSNLKDENFVKAAAEYKAKQDAKQEKGRKNDTHDNKSNTPLYISLAILIITGLAGLIYWLSRKNNKN